MPVKRRVVAVLVWFATDLEHRAPSRPVGIESTSSRDGARRSKQRYSRLNVRATGRRMRPMLQGSRQPHGPPVFRAGRKVVGHAPRRVGNDDRGIGGVLYDMRNK